MNTRPWALILAVAVLTPLPGPAEARAATGEAAEKDVNKELTPTVMITVNFRPKAGEKRAPEQGTGVVICQEDEKYWILTANHVFAGRSEEPYKQFRWSQIESATIEFFEGRADPVEGEGSSLRKEIKIHSFKGEDLLLLSLPFDERLPSTADLSPPPGEGEEFGVSATGWWKAMPDGTWSRVEGELKAASPKFLYHTGEVHQGFSGGPLYNDKGNVIGINIQRVPGEQTSVPEVTGVEDPWYGKAQALNSPEILSIIKKHLPAKCLENTKELDELAYLIYRDAMEAVSIRRWDEAVPLLQQALQQRDNPGGRVHLEGMRYTTYLPYFHLGLALYKQGQYSDAIGAWDQSEAKRLIQTDKRYRKLKRDRKRAYEALSRQEREAAKKKLPTLMDREAEAAQQRAEARAKQEQETKKREAEQAKIEEQEAEEAKAREAEEKRKEEEARAAREREEERTPTHRVTARPCLNLRKEPSLRGARIGCIQSGSGVKVVAEKEGWSQVRHPGWRGEEWLEGWVASEYLDALLVDELTEALPSHRIAVQPCLVLRQGPSRGTGRLACLESGSKVLQLFQREGWSRVRLQEGREGWMYSSHLEPVESAESG